MVEATSRPRTPAIVIATVQRILGETGLETVSAEFGRYLRQDDVPVSLVTPVSHRKSLALPLLAMRKLIAPLSGALDVLWFRWSRKLLLRAALADKLRNDRPTVIYALCPVSAQAAHEARRGRHQKIVMSVRFNHSQAEEWCNLGRIEKGGRVCRRIEALEARLLPQLDGLHFVSRYMRDYIHDRHPGTRGVRSIVLPNFVTGPDDGTRRHADGDLVSIGTLEPRKNQAYLIRVLYEAGKLGRCYTLTLIGRGPDRRRLEALARALGVEAQVRFLGYRPNAAELLSRYRVYVHGARAENFPFVLVEAQAHGLPALAPPVGGIGEALTDGVNGYLWSLDDPGEGARKLMSILEDDATYERFSRAARARFETRYSTAVVAPKLRDYLLGTID